MSDRYFALTVVLDRNFRDEDAQLLMQAIQMIRGVATVQPHVADPLLLAATQRVRKDLEVRMWEALHGKEKA